ncbi:hypothetical protein SAY87_013321 [Trapa incisa]|uniref:Uncharacterized protein n=1 Tax=Trapa incisa TaxID=236973 RepID=A0AAN7KG51_9MYRT|nr:hypothetical protein SAY87_013321 [Trapa incisa]
MTMTEQALEKVHLRGRAPQIVPSFSGSEPELDAEKLGVASDLRDFVKGFTARTFQSFPIQGSRLSLRCEKKYIEEARLKAEEQAKENKQDTAYSCRGPKIPTDWKCHQQ